MSFTDGATKYLADFTDFADVCILILHDNIKSASSVKSVREKY
ncbi:hypothetical protein ABEG63_16260 [Chryseobacterium sp. C39-AII1]